MSHSDIVFNGSIDLHASYACGDDEPCGTDDWPNQELLAGCDPDNTMVFSFGHRYGETRVRVVLTREELKRWIKFLKGAKKSLDFNREIAMVKSPAGDKNDEE